MNLAASVEKIEIKTIGSNAIKVANVTFKVVSETSSALKGIQIPITLEVDFDGDFDNAVMEAMNELHALGDALSRAAVGLREKM